MPEIVLVRQPDVHVSDADREAARRVLFAHIEGLGEVNRKRWRNFISTLMRLDAGEVATIKTEKARSHPFHRRHMAMEQQVFEAQERFENFERGFRDWLKVGAGHCDWHPGPKGGVFPVPKSISYTEMEEGEMREFHDAAVAFLRTAHAQKTLWPHLAEAVRAEMIETILGEFGE
ncbi:DUF1367 family protein [Pseudomethylobacillus aquaticus]|uniref:DUF1367 family protein n=1 Tax=Pseudomethylobacillus aquaticus TaxID=2676064 RepID=A0A3N0V5B8_9PROT|nr:DUF1367 family protein [Pseudomethylobacillus aquaticus]ROH87986.1 DUF1367 family protein [Pseudomethylobacillus aquaticus]